MARTNKLTEDLIRDDEEDLEKLEQQLEKVQKLKKQHAMQKQEIGELKNAIDELKSENQELKSLSQVNQKSHKGKKQERQTDEINSDDQEIKKQFVNPPIRSRTIENDLDQTGTQKVKKKTRVWNINDNYKKQPVFQDNYPAPPMTSIRNHPGYVSAGRFHSPQPRSHFPVQQYSGTAHNFMSGQAEPEVESRYETSYFLTKNKLVDNLVQDLRFEIEDRESELQDERSGHKNTKKMLQKTLKQNERLSSHNHRLGSEFEMLSKQKEYLEQELIRQTEQKYRAEAVGQEFVAWQQTTARAYYDQMDKQFQRMDQIYYEFLRVAGVDGRF